MAILRGRRAAALRRWAVAVAVYLVAVFHRTSLGVAGLQASSRFGISPSQLSIFVLLQVGVYAAMQIPTGVLVDRYGPRRLLVPAAVVAAARCRLDADLSGRRAGLGHHRRGGPAGAGRRSASGAPSPRGGGVALGVRAVDHRVRSAWALPGTRAGFWVHFTSMSTALTFGVLCGVPFLVQAQGLSRDAASALLLVSVLGWYLVLGVFTGTIPRWLRVALVLITAAGTPISSIGFAVARDYNGPTTVGTRHALLRALDLGHSAPVAIVRHRWGLS